MCEACDRFDEHQLSRRGLLRKAAVGGLLVTAPLWLPELPLSDVGLALAGDGGTASGTGSSRAATPRTNAAGTPRLTRVIPAPNLAATAAPIVISRKGWRADESIRVNERKYAPIRKLIVHHTASANRPKDPAAVVRETYAYHTVTRGYTDIGYNFMIDHKGRIYEGRFARNYASGEIITGEDAKGWGVVGGHTKDNNAGACGVCLIGDFDTGSPTDAAIASLTVLLAWKASRHRIDGQATDEYVNLLGEENGFGNIDGHRSIGATACPGKRLFAALPALRKEVVRRAGHWDPLVVNIPAVTRTEYGPGAPGIAPTRPDQRPGNDLTGSRASASTKVTAYRALSSGGSVFTVGKATKAGQPGGSGLVAIANPGWGDGFLTLTAGGRVQGFGGLRSNGDVAGRDLAAAVDLAMTASGGGHWILLRDGSIYPFGDARYYSSPRRFGIAPTSVRMAARPQGDGYWVLTTDGKVRGFGAAKAMGAPVAPAGARAVDLAATPSGKGYWVLLDNGDVGAFGDAGHLGGIAGNKRWIRPAVAITALPSGDGYVVSARDGALYCFGAARFIGTFAGSGATVVGIAPACAA
jgi:hypothetical protein